MANIILGCDTNTGNDANAQKTVADGLRKAGHNVQELSIGPTPFSKYAYTADAKGKIGMYLMAASLFSFADGASDLYDKDIFIIRGDASERITSEEAFNTLEIRRDPDCNSACDGWEGMTYPQLNQKAKGKCVAVYGGKTAEEMLQAALGALNGVAPTSSGGGTTNTSGGGGSAVLIPDKTFYGLIKQIIGAIDGVFTIANNMAYLLSFKDMYKYRNIYEEYIPELKMKDIVIDGVTRNWTTENLYNAVEVTYADGIIKYQHDALVTIYGEHTFYYEFPTDDEETAKDKARALLSAHIRDYSLDLEIDCVYNPNITVGGWIKIPKTLTNINSDPDKEGPIKKHYKAKEKKKRKGVNITNINETTQKIDDTNKTIQHITTDDGEKYDVEIEKKDYEIYFVQAYRFRWTPKNAPVMSLHLKYGPDTPEDPVNATVGTGGVQASTSTSIATNGAAAWGSDCFSICDICIENCDKILPYGSGRREDAEEYIRKHEPDSKYLQGRAKQNSSYAKDVNGKTPQEAYLLFRTKFDYACYSDSCDSAYPCCDDLWQKATAANCGDSTRMLKALMDTIGIPCYGIHVDGHYFNAIQVSGTWHTLDGTRGPTNSSCGFPDAESYGCGSNSCGSGCCS